MKGMGAHREWSSFFPASKGSALLYSIRVSFFPVLQLSVLQMLKFPGVTVSGLNRTRLESLTETTILLYRMTPIILQYMLPSGA